ncbi:hypothetical protein [Salinivibrio socompensis]|uniref:hypothetical protein n=1 Tax=Salinivibrio socompensis TaxID=1510206 RepID=UPI00055A845E|nr:hypothetical protein [Salinivibrio socompensis]
MAGLSAPLLGVSALGRHTSSRGGAIITHLAFTLGFAGLEVIRQHTWRASRLTGTLGIATGLTMIPYFYPQALGYNSGYALTALALSLGFFSALQQFIFNHAQRQKLLTVLLLASWLAVLSVLGNQPRPAWHRLCLINGCLTSHQP